MILSDITVFRILFNINFIFYGNVSNTCMLHVYRCLQGPVEDIRFPEPRVIGDCELTNMGSGNLESGPLDVQQAFYPDETFHQPLVKHSYCYISVNLTYSQ